CVAVVNWDAVPLFVGEGSLRCFLHVLLKSLFAVILLNKETCEVSCESLAEPQVGPGRLRYRIAEPLMCDFVSNDIFNVAGDTKLRADFGGWSRTEECAGENDSARVLHTTKSRCAD